MVKKSVVVTPQKTYESSDSSSESDSFEDDKSSKKKPLVLASKKVMSDLDFFIGDRDNHVVSVADGIMIRSSIKSIPPSGKDVSKYDVVQSMDRSHKSIGEEVLSTQRPPPEPPPFMNGSAELPLHHPAGMEELPFKLFAENLGKVLWGDCIENSIYTYTCQVACRIKFTQESAKDFSEEKPFVWSHFTAEGDVEFKAMLFVPSKTPNMIRKIVKEDPDEYGNKDKSDTEATIENDEKKGSYAKFWTKLLRFESTKSEETSKEQIGADSFGTINSEE